MGKVIKNQAKSDNIEIIKKKEQEKMEKENIKILAERLNMEIDAEKLSKEIENLEKEIFKLKGGK
ncbi:MAG: hypothetical protein II978_05465 [Clostridia bacterium]|nr:hypothetical protein [Clostridia bacterium]